MNVENLIVKRSDLEVEVLPRLRETVFHVTSESAFSEILTSGVIRSNQTGELEFTFPQSANSYGRLQGYVCLFDLRGIQDEILRESLHKFYFVRPKSTNPAFLFLKEATFPEILPWTVAPTGAMLIPHVEAWYPGDVPMAAVDRALHVTIEVDDIDSAFRGVMRSLHRDKDELLDSSQVTIEGRTESELRERAEEWVRVAQGAGLTVRGWEPGRIVRTPGGFAVSVRALRADYWESIGVSL